MSPFERNLLMLAILITVPFPLISSTNYYYLLITFLVDCVVPYTMCTIDEVL
jgi:hypothetical protein